MGRHLRLKAVPSDAACRRFRFEADATAPARGRATVAKDEKQQRPKCEPLRQRGSDLPRIERAFH
jgi:hypothetical protein